MYCFFKGAALPFVHKIGHTKVKESRGEKAYGRIVKYEGRLIR